MTPGESAGPAAVDEPARQEAEREELPERLAQAEDRHRRALADLDNLRKRTAREIERRVEESRESLLLEWLEALDSVERALLMTPEGPVQDGLRSVLAQMEAILARNGVAAQRPAGGAIRSRAPRGGCGARERGRLGSHHRSRSCARVSRWATACCVPPR